MQDVATELAALDRMSTGDLAERYQKLYGRPCRTRHRQYLIRKVAWRIQANAEGDLSERARKRAAEFQMLFRLTRRTGWHRLPSGLGMTS